MPIDIKQTHLAHEFVHNRPLICCRFDPTGKFIFAGGEDNLIHRWAIPAFVKQGQPKPAAVPPVAFAAHDSWIYGLALTADGKQLLSVAGDGKLIWWDALSEKPTPIRTVQAHDGWARAVAISPDGKLIATGGNDNLVNIWNLATGARVHRLAGHTNRVYSVHFHPNGSLFSGDLSGNVKQWDVAAGKEQGTFTAKELYEYNAGQGVDFGGVRGLTVSLDQKTLFAGGLYKATNPLGAVHEPIVLAFDLATKQKVRTFAPPNITGGVIWRLRTLVDGTIVGVSGGGSGGILLFWHPEQEKELHRVGLPNIARDCDATTTSELIATTHHDQRVRIYKLGPPV